MNVRTTLFLGILLVLGVIAFLVAAYWQPFTATSESVAILQDSLTAKSIIFIKIKRDGGEIEFKRSKSGDWSLPGQWPIRKPQVESLVRELTQLSNTRFFPISIANNADLEVYGLKTPALQIAVKAGGKEVQLQFGEPLANQNRFSSPTYLRVDKKLEILELAPGLIARLNKPQEYYQQRRLFPAERVADKDEPAKKIEKLAGQTITAKDESREFTVKKKDKGWVLQKPVSDRVDPEKLESLLVAIPDLWAEQFIEKNDKKLKDFGLEKPAKSLIVTNNDGEKLTLYVGSVSKTDTRIEKMPAPPQMPGRPPMPPQPKIVQVEYRYAKLGNNDQIFEIKAENFDKIFIDGKSLRDAKLARFETGDVHKVEIKDGKKIIVLAKKKDDWRVEAPGDYAADNSKVDELLNNLSGLEASDDSVIDEEDAKKYGLEKPAAITLTIEKENKDKKKETSEIRFALGKHDAKDKKLYVRVDDWKRINKVDEELWKLAKRDVLKYRNRTVLDLQESDLATISVDTGKEKVTLEQKKDEWRLVKPVQTAIDTSKATDLVFDIGRLNAEEFVTNKADAKELQTKYGLAKPQRQIIFTLKDKKKKPKSLLIGKKRKSTDKEKDKDDAKYFAKLSSDPAIFVIKKNVFDILSRDSLSYRPLQLWSLNSDEIDSLSIGRDKDKYELKRDKDDWKISGPFAAAAAKDAVKELTEKLTTLKAEKFVAHTAKDLGKYGLDKTFLRLVVTPKEKKDEKEKQKQRVLLVGKEIDKDSKNRFARLADSEAIFVLTEETVKAVNRGALDLLDRNLLSIDIGKIQKIQIAGKQKISLEHDKQTWKVSGSPGSPFDADEQAVSDHTAVLADLKAKSFAAYGPKLDLAKFGLEKPEVTVTVTLKPEDKKSKSTTHTIAIGKPVGEKSKEHFARIDNGKGVVVLAADVADRLNQTHLDFVNRAILQLDADKIKSVERQSGGKTLELTKKDADWAIQKPAKAAADQESVKGLVGKLAALRAEKIAAFPAKDVKPFGLDKPAALVTLSGNDAKAKQLKKVLHIGNKVGKDGKGYYARIASQKVVFVLNEELGEQLLAAPLEFENRNLVKLESADKVVAEDGAGRKVTFKLENDTWKMTAPIKSDAESDELKSFVESVVKLRADKLVAAKPADLKLYGLAKPQRRWQFFSGDKEVAGLSIGSIFKDKSDDKRRYAKLDGKDLVFLLNPKDSGSAFAEYRKRKVIADLDSAQITKLTYDYGKDRFVLEKDGTDWKTDAPKTKIDGDRVIDAAKALADLKVERFVLDKGANLKLYGLDPPALKLYIKTETDSHLLLIGNKKGGASSYYAGVSGDENNSVFLISGDDAEKIVRSLAGFKKINPTNGKKDKK